jgi:MFS family permease
MPIYLILLLWMILWSASVSGPVLPLYVESLGIGVIGWSLLATSSAVGMFLFEWLWGALADRVDRRLLMLFSVLCMSALFPLYTLRPLIPYLLILQFFSGAIGVILGPTTRAYVSDESPHQSLGFFASLWWAFLTVGRTIGPLIGTYLAELYTFSFSFYTSTVLALVLACLIVLNYPKLKPSASASPQKIQTLRPTLHTRSAGFLFLSVMFAFMTVALMRSFLPIYASEQIKMSTVEVGVLLSATSAAQLAAIPLLGWLSDKFGKRRVVGVGFGLTSILFLFYLVAGTESQLFLVSVVVSLGLCASFLPLALIPEVTPNTLYGSAVGMYGSFEDLGVIIGPLVYGFVWSNFSPVLIFAVGSLTQLISALLIFAVKPQRARN